MSGYKNSAPRQKRPHKLQKQRHGYLFWRNTQTPTRFEAQAMFQPEYSATAEIFYKEGPGSLLSVFGSESKYWSADMRKALGIAHVAADGFSLQLSQSGLKGNDLPIPAEGFFEAAPRLKKIFINQINIYVTPDQ